MSYADPVPQAVVLTSIVVGLSIVIVLIALAIRIYEKYGTFDITQIKDLKG
jgi:multisubunit Na+/H+ antiporter MnhC subunit